MGESQWVIEVLESIWHVLRAPIVELKGTKLSVSGLILALVIVVCSFQIANFIGRALNRFLSRKLVDTGVRDSLEKFVRYAVISLGVVLAFDILGFSLNSLAAIGAILMVGIGFGLQNITQNFVSGIIILIERPVKVGDIIQVGDTRGKVIDIRVRSTVILTRDDVSIIMPNSKLVSEQVINESFTDNRIRQHVRVGVAYGSNTELVRQTLLESLANHPKVLQEPHPMVVFEEFGDSSLNFDLRFWTHELWDVDVVCSEIRFSIDQAFRQAGVTIPFPQRDLHLKTGWPAPN